MQYNIFNNDFYEDMPGVPWAYRIDVFIGDPPQAIAKLAKAVKEIDIPDAELETMDAFHAGLVFKIPTRYKNSNSYLQRRQESVCVQRAVEAVPQILRQP